MRLFKREEPAKTVKLADLYPEYELSDEGEAIAFDIYRFGQRTFQHPFLRLGGSEVAAAMSAVAAGGEGVDEMALLGGQPHEEICKLARVGVIAEAHNLPPAEENGSGEADALDALFDELRDLPWLLLAAAQEAQTEHDAAAKEAAGKSSASSPAETGKQAQSNEG